MAKRAAKEPKVAETGAYMGVVPDPVLKSAQIVDARLRESAPDGWRGVLPKEQEVKRLIYEVVLDTALVEELFSVVKARAEY